MKRLFTFFLAIVLLNTVALGQSVSVTYTAGDIPTDYQSPWVGPSSCPGEMTVTIPAGNWITGIDVSYSMTAQNVAYMSEQRSRLFSPTLGTGEDSYATGSGTGGTMSYNRVNLDFANYATGDVIIQMDAGRTWGNTAPNNGCGTHYNKVDNNTWVMTVYYELIPPCPAPFLLTVTDITSTSAVLGWTPLGSETLWNLKHGAPGFDPATEGTLVSGLTTPSYPLAGLTPLTAYEFYVQADCGSGDLSPWAGPEPFMTIADMISGTYTINSNLPTGGNNFNNFSDLAIALNTGGLNGSLTLNVVAGSGPYNEQVIIGEVIGSSAVNTITINGNGETLEYLSTNTNERATLKLNGTDYVSVDNLIIKALGAGSGEYGFVVHLQNEADHNTFTNCLFEANMTSTSSSFAGFVTSNSNTSATLSGLAASNLTITNCISVGGYYGMVINGPTNTSGPPHSENNVITNNVIRDFRLYGLYMRGQNNSLYAENTIHRPDRDNLSTTYMMYITQNMNGTEIIKNEIYEFAGNANVTSSAYGIYGTSITCDPGSELLIANNLVYGYEGMNGIQRGIVLFTTDHAKIYHNTISVDNVNHTGSSAIQGIYHTGNGNTIDIRNNIVSVTSNSTGTKYCLYFSQTAANAPVLTTDNNVLYMGAIEGTNHTVYWTGSPYTTLADWQNAGGGVYDQNSKDDDPIFVNLVGGNLTPMSPYINDIGANLLADVPDDFFGVARTVTPDPGAIEFMPVGEGTISGVVRDANTNQPVIGAVVTLGSNQVLTGAGGTYEFTRMGGDYVVQVQKVGYEDLSQVVTVVPFEVTETDLLLYELANAPGAVHAALNATQTAVNLNWGLPNGPYEIVYDDGVFENMTAWSQAGGINALRFTPIAHPVQIIAGSIHIGDGSYPPTQNLPNTFEVAIYSQDASPFGWPDEELARFDVTRDGNVGWISFELPEPVTITSGDFYIGMIQAGNFPNTVGIAIDETDPVNRSYAKFATGPWTLAGFQDFMIRAVVSGSGGPWGGILAGEPQFVEPVRHHREALSMSPARSTGGLVGDATYIPLETGMPAPEELIGYSVYRFEQGNEGGDGDESLWSHIGSPTNNAFVDNGWTSLPDGAYRWAVKARYTGDRLSAPSLSNVLGKGFTVDAVTFNLALSSGATPAGIEVVMVNQLVPDTTYAAMSGDDGVVVINNIWKGTYDITVYKFGFEPWTITEELTANKTYNVMLMQMNNPPRDLYVHNRTLMATWDQPIMQALILEETFSSGSFATNDWTSEPNWSVISSLGNPAPSARFYYSPSITNYSRSLTSKMLQGVGSPEVFFEYDIYLNNYGTTTIEKMAAEFWDGAEWIALKTYDNSSGSDIPWTSERLDITEYVDGDFRIRFRAYGDDSFNINNWNVDNIRLLGVETDFTVMGYNFYLDDLQVDFVEENEYQVPPILMTYGQTYLAEVAAVYQSGISPRIGYSFTSYFLAKPNNFQGVNVENAVHLTWEPPFIPVAATVISTEPRTDYPDPNADYSPTIVHMNYPENREIFDVLGSFPHNDAGGEYGVATDGNFIYTARWNSGDFFRYNMDGTYVGSFTVAGAGSLRDLTYDGQYFYGSNNSSTIYEMDLANETLVSSISTTASSIRAIAYDAVNDGFWVSNGWNPPLTLLSRTGASLQTISTAASSFSGLGWENISDGGPFIWGYTQPASNNILVKIDMATGATLETFDVGTTGLIGAGSISGGFNITNLAVPGKWAFLGAAQNDVVWMLELADDAGGGVGVEGLIGYNIYRDGAEHAFVEVPDLEFWDLNLMPGTYKYSATAVYEIGEAGSGNTDESLHTPEIEVGVNDFGYSLPFVEEWNSANFSFNNWLITGDDGHWRVTTSQGNPVPAVEFTWSPPVKDYEYIITSPALNAAPFVCADIYLDFDIKLNDRNTTGGESLAVQYFANGNWLPLEEFTNNGSFNWSPQSVMMPAAAGKTFHVRFVATGDNSADILSWFIDNIHVYAECRAPLDLTGSQIGTEQKAYLEWSEPDCDTGPTGQLVKLSQWDGAPENAYFQSYNMAYGVVYDLAAYPDATLELVDFHHASWGVLGIWDYKIHVVDWDTHQLIATIDDLKTTGNDKWENGIQLGEIVGQGGGLVGIMMEAMSNAPDDAYPTFSADNALNGVSVFGQIPNWSDFAASGVGDFLQNLWIRTSFTGDDRPVKLEPVNTSDLIAETRMPVLKCDAADLMQYSKLIPSFDNASKESPVMGYNIYRSDDLGETFNLITPAPVIDLTYTDLDVEYEATYHYYTTAVYEDDICESVPSNEVIVDIIIGVNEIDKEGISIYPVPANNALTIAVNNDIRSMRIMNYMGQMVYEQNFIKDKVIHLNTANYQPGAYSVQLVTESGQTITRRFVIAR
jgi:hypothetical protein